MQQPGRPREFDEDDTLTKIMQLFWENGYEATGLSDIIAATGLGKASLYGTFGNKHSMYILALRHYEKLVVNIAVSVLGSKDLVALKQIEAFLSLPIIAVEQQKDRKGCFLCNAAADRASLDPEAGAQVQHGYEVLRKAIAAALSRAFPILSPDKIKVRTELVLTLYSGMRVMARSGQTSEMMTATRDAFMETLN